MIYLAAVTFESNVAPPKTWRGEVEASGPNTAASRAVREAKKAFPGVRWASMSILLEKPKMEGADTDEPETEEEAETES